jgi:hypothetical protein
VAGWLPELLADPLPELWPDPVLEAGAVSVPEFDVGLLTTVDAAAFDEDDEATGDEVVAGLVVDTDDEAGETGVVTGWVTAAVTAAWLGEVVLCLTVFGLWWCALARRSARALEATARCVAAPTNTDGDTRDALNDDDRRGTCWPPAPTSRTASTAAAAAATSPTRSTRPRASDRGRPVE